MYLYNRGFYSKISKKINKRYLANDSTRAGFREGKILELIFKVKE